MSQSVYDIVVIGAGPNGLYAAYKLQMELPWIRLLVIEADEICGSISKYPDVRWHSKMKELKLPSQINPFVSDDYEPTSSELVSYYNLFCKEHSLSVRTKSKVINLTERSEIEGDRLLALEFAEVTEKENEVLTRFVILATGIYDSPRSLEIRGKHKLSTNFRLDQQNLDLLLIGAGNSAADFIIYLLPHNKITWVIRGDSWNSVFANLRGNFDSVIEKFGHNLTLITNSEVEAIEDSGHVVLKDGGLLGPFDQYFSLIGFNSLNPLVRSIGLETQFECLALTDCFETSLESVFAFGSLMATWNPETNRANPTFVHNGNDHELGIIVKELKRRWSKAIFLSDQSRAVQEKLPRRLNLRFAAKFFLSRLPRRG